MIKKLINSTFGKLNNAVFRNVLIVGSIGVIIKIVSFYKETLVSSTFGLSTLLDTFQLAILIPSFIQMMALRALNNLFIPNYIYEMKTTKQLGSFQTFIFSTISILFLTLSAIVLVFSFFLEDVFTGHTLEYYALLRKQLYIVLPCILLWGYSSVLEGLLDIENKFYQASITMAFVPIVTIINVIFFKDVFGQTVLVWSMLIGSVLSFGYLVLIARKLSILKFGKFQLNENIHEMIRQYPPKVASALLTGINPFVDQLFAAQLIVGSVASINYGIKLPTIMTGLLMLALGKVFLPYFSRALAENVVKAYSNLFKVLAFVFFGSLLVTIIFIIWSQDIVQILFERGEFEASDTLVVGRIQQIAFVYVPFFLCTLVTVKFLTAANKNKFMAWVSLSNLIVNLVMNFILVEQYGIYGLVISTTIVYIISSIIYFSYTYHSYKKTVKNKN